MVAFRCRLGTLTLDERVVSNQIPKGRPTLPRGDGVCVSSRVKFPLLKGRYGSNGGRTGFNRNRQSTVLNWPFPCIETNRLQIRGQKIVARGRP
jgi:hypothetical protein